MATLKAGRLSTVVVALFLLACGEARTKQGVEADGAGEQDGCGRYRQAVEVDSLETEEVLSAARRDQLGNLAESAPASTLSMSFDEPLERSDLIELADTLDLRKVTAAYHPFTDNTTFYTSFEFTPGVSTVDQLDRWENLMVTSLTGRLGGPARQTSGEPPGPPDASQLPGDDTVLVPEGGSSAEASAQPQSPDASDRRRIEDTLQRVESGELPVVRVAVTGDVVAMQDVLDRFDTRIAFAAMGDESTEARLVDDEATREALDNQCGYGG